jgi:hypothetical protein
MNYNAVNNIDVLETWVKKPKKSRKTPQKIKVR